MPAKLETRTCRGTPRNLRQLARALQRGEIVAVPTETVYGLAGNALDPKACRRIFQAKGRPTSDPLIVHIHDFAQLELIAQPNDAARKLARAFWPGPLTMVLPKHGIIPAIVTAGLPSVAVRMPRHPLFRRLLRLTRLPLAAPSANPFGYVSPTTAAHVRENLGGKIRHILDGGPAKIGLESTIVDLRHPRSPRLLRSGAITKRELERVLGSRVIAGKRRRRSAQVAPGLLSRHYSPRTPAILHERLSVARAKRSDGGEAWIFFARPSALRGPNIFWLDEHGRAQHAAKRLFGVLRDADSVGFRRIHLERARGGGVADAINDRLERAAASRGTS